MEQIQSTKHINNNHSDDERNQKSGIKVKTEKKSSDNEYDNERDAEVSGCIVPYSQVLLVVDIGQTVRYDFERFDLFGIVGSLAHVLTHHFSRIGRYLVGVLERVDKVLGRDANSVIGHEERRSDRVRAVRAAVVDFYCFAVCCVASFGAFHAWVVFQVELEVPDKRLIHLNINLYDIR